MKRGSKEARETPHKREPDRKKGANEIWVTYGQTRGTGTQFEFDRLDLGFARDLKPDEDREEAMIEEAEGLQVLVKNFLAGEY